MVLTSHTKTAKMNSNVILHVIYTIVMKLIHKFVYQNHTVIIMMYINSEVHNKLKNAYKNVITTEFIFM